MHRNLNHLATFAAVAEAGSFAGAARRLGLPASTVSEHIAALETGLGLQLVARTTRRCRLTDAGRTVAQGAAKLVAAAEDALARADNLRDRPEGTLRVSLPFAFAADLIGPAVARFGDQYPGIRIDLRVSNDRDDLIADGLDLAIRVGRLPDSTLTRRSLWSEPRDLVAARGYLEAEGWPTGLDDLARHRIVGYRSEQTVTCTGPDGPASVTLRAALSANEPKTVLALVESGAGIGVLPRFLTRASLGQGRIEIVLPESRIAPMEISIVYHGRAERKPLADLFVTFLQTQLPRPDMRPPQ